MKSKKMPAHGTVTRYYNYKCRCKKCRAAGTTYMRELRAKMKTTPEKKIPHGTVNGYENYGCRCRKCVKAKSAARRAQYAASKQAVA